MWIILDTQAMFFFQCLGMTDDPSIYPGLLAFTFGAIIMATFSLRQTKEDGFGKIEEWSFSEDIQEAEMIENTPKKKQ